MTVVCIDQGIAGISLRGGRSSLKLPSKLTKASKTDNPFASLQKKLRAYVRGKRVRFEHPLDLTGTPFQKRVWKAIASIPYGETRSYKWLAAKAGRPKAIRAAAQACGANPVPIIIPCHRVIASNGSLGGFSGGLDLKKKLHRIEGISRGTRGKA
jgi:O-6-methylguanine DNA methyltransferase